MESQSVKQLDSIQADGQVAITSLGMACALGLNHIHACAAARAGITRISELKTLNLAMSPGFGRELVAGFPELKGHSVPDVGFGYIGPAKLLALAESGLRDLLAHRPLSIDEQRSTRIILNLSDGVIGDAARGSTANGASGAELPSADFQKRTKDFAIKLIRRMGLAIPSENFELLYGGHVGIIEGMIRSIRLFQKNSAARVIIGGVESCVEPAFLFDADRMGVLRTNENPVGFIPGEAAAFFMLERVPPPGDVSGRKAIRVQSAVMTADPSSLFSESMPVGEGLAVAVERAIQMAGESPDFLLGDLNGLERRASDWGHVLSRGSRMRGLGELPLWLPALSFGETGAAAVATAVNMAARAWQRGYAPGGRAVLWAASDDQRRAALALQFVA